MALPSTIESQPLVSGFMPPYKSSAGNFYVFSVEASAAGFNIEKASDPTVSANWVIQDAANNPTDTVSVVSSVQYLDQIHITYFDSGGSIYKYCEFDMSDDTWKHVTTGSGVTVEDVSGMKPPTDPWCSIAIREGATNEIVVAYAGIKDAVMGTDYERVDFRSSDITTPSFGATVAIDAGGEIFYANPNLVVGTNDKVHVFFGRDTTGVAFGALEDIQARTIATDDTLSTVQTVSAGLEESLLSNGIANARSWDDAGTQRVGCIYRDKGIGAASARARICKGVENVNDEISALTIVAISHSDNDPGANPEISPMSLANDGTTLHVLWMENDTVDLFYDTSTDSGATWGTDVEELDLVTINYVYSNIYQRGDNVVLAYVYDDGGTTKYNEKNLTDVSITALNDADVGDSMNNLYSSYFGPFEI